MLRFHLVSLFPEFFRSPLETALLGRAREAGIVDFSFHDPRSFSTSRHHHVDDRPYGGGPGMVMQGEPVAAALRSIEKPGRMILLAPSGRPLNDALARELAREEDLTLICGRYEGLDARLLDIFPLEPVSVGEAVLNGGETAALAVIESVARLVPGFMGKEESGDDESFSNGLLEYPHYTRPEVLEGREVPEVLRGGDHGAVARWRRQQSLATTLRVRPDLLDSAPLVAEDARHLATLPRTRAGRNLSFLPRALSRAAGPEKFRRFLFDKFGYSRYSPDFPQLCDGTVLCRDPAVEDQQRLLQAIVRHWTQGAGSRGNPDRAQALATVCPAESVDAAVEHLTERTGMRPRVVASSASWPAHKHAPPPLCPADVCRMCEEGPVLLLLGTAQGLAPEVLARCDGVLRPIRYLGYNHLSVRSAAAILADRILGDYK